MFTLEYHINNTYRFTGDFTADDFVRFVAHASVPYQEISLKDSGDAGMSYFGGKCTPEEYFALSGEKYLDLEYIYAQFPGVSMFARDYDHTIDVSTSDPCFDLDSFLFGSRSGTQLGMSGPIGPHGVPDSVPMPYWNLPLPVKECDISHWYEISRIFHYCGRNVYLIREKPDMGLVGIYGIALYEPCFRFYHTIDIYNKDYEKIVSSQYRREVVLSLAEESLGGVLYTGFSEAEAIEPYLPSSDVVFGRYPQEKNGEIAPIEWIVLAREQKRMLLISKYALDCKQFHTCGESVAWKNCSLRRWLNETFLHEAFSEEEQQRIQCVCTSEESDLSDGTKDKVFLLSADEVKQYFGLTILAECEETEYCFSAAKRSIHQETTVCWWLRSPGDEPFRARFVSERGSYRESLDAPVDHTGIDVRPALWITYDS